MKVGLIGVGNIGQHFAARILAAGQQLVVFDLNQEALKRCHEQGAEIANSVVDLASTGGACVSLPADACCRPHRQRTSDQGHQHPQPDRSFDNRAICHQRGG